MVDRELWKFNVLFNFRDVTSGKGEKTVDVFEFIYL